MRKTTLPPFAAALLLSACSAPGQDSTGEKGETEQSQTIEVADSPAEQAAPVDPEVAEARDALSERIAELGENFGGSLGIAIVDVKSGWSTGFNESKLLPQQSVSKLWVSLAALELADRGELDLESPIDIRREDLTVFYQPIRRDVLRRGVVRSDPLDLIERAITESDNTANDVLLRQLGGPDTVRQVLASKGLDNIRFGPGERAMQSAIAGLNWKQEYAYTREGFFDARDAVPDALRKTAFENYLSDPVDGATPLAIAEALAALARGDLLSAASTERLIATLQRTKSGPRRLKAGAPAGWTVAHKTGTGQFYDGRQSGYNDVGLVTSPDGRTYAIAIMIGETRRSTPERMDMMQAVTRAVAEFDAALPQS